MTITDVESALNSLIPRIWEASWQATVLAGIILVVQWLLRSQLSARWRNALWLLVFARLLLPALPHARFSAYNWLLPKIHAIPAVVTAGTFAPGVHIRTLASPLLDGATAIPNNPLANWPIPLFLAKLPGAFPHPLSMMALLWMAGALATAIWSIAGYMRLRRRVMRSSGNASGFLNDLFIAAKAQLGVRHAELIISTAASTPFVTGFWKAKVILPQGLETKLQPGDMRMVLLHELAHVKRGDLWVAWLSWLVTTLHWFNPAVRFAMARARKDREMACDEWVMRYTKDSKGYGAALIRFLEFSHDPLARAGLGSIGIFESKLSLIQRIRRIAAYRSATFFGSAIGFAVLAAIGVFTLTAATAEAPPVQLVLELSDGSRVVGTTAMDGLKITTQYADMNIQLSKLRSIEFKGTDHTALVSLQNGDTVSGQLAIKEIEMKTSFGQVAVPLAQVSRMRVATTGLGRIMPEGCVLYYTFDEDEGEKVTDQSGSGNDGTIHGATRVKDGKLGAALSFSGANGQKVITKNEDKLQLQDFTIMAWVKRDSTDKSSIEWAEGGAVFICGQGGYAFGLYADGSLGLSKVGFNGITAPCKITDKDFHHIAVTKSGSKVVFYLDGKPSAMEFDTQFQFGNGMAVGARPDVENAMEACFLGTIDELAIFNRPLTEDEVKKVYESQK